MRLLLDTNVLSEVTKPTPEPRVLEWLDRLDEDRSFISVVSIAEIRRGVALMDEGRKRETLAWGNLMALAKRRGRGLSSMDGLIAATAIAKQFTLATRNKKDFEGFGIDLFDPWSV